ncbi:hypothetical protein DFH94DRAFT_686901 [Russula ochroleuca]|uniref:Uncharacterized protein n=1 Tax=Russula ochroleuca TaxID=152965 RepID=A0A9P5JTC9_9AGAM|nr:hypothetical protein DFH94DRAFT_686901 [Russula ochroleuca]
MRGSTIVEIHTIDAQNKYESTLLSVEDGSAHRREEQNNDEVVGTFKMMAGTVGGLSSPMYNDNRRDKSELERPDQVTKVKLFVGYLREREKNAILYDDLLRWHNSGSEITFIVWALSMGVNGWPSRRWGNTIVRNSGRSSSRSSPQMPAHRCHAGAEVVAHAQDQPLGQREHAACAFVGTGQGAHVIGKGRRSLRHAILPVTRPGESEHVRGAAANLGHGGYLKVEAGAGYAK